MSYVVFDGTSHYIVDKYELDDLLKCDDLVEIVFKSQNFELCCDKVDELNDELGY